MIKRRKILISYLFKDMLWGKVGVFIFWLVASDDLSNPFKNQDKGWLLRQNPFNLKDQGWFWGNFLRYRWYFQKIKTTLFRFLITSNFSWSKHWLFFSQALFYFYFYFYFFPHAHFQFFWSHFWSFLLVI